MNRKVVWNHVLFISPKICVSQTRKMHFLPFNKAMQFTNFLATVKVVVVLADPF